MPVKCSHCGNDKPHFMDLTDDENPAYCYLCLGTFHGEEDVQELIDNNIMQETMIPIGKLDPEVHLLWRDTNFGLSDILKDILSWGHGSGEELYDWLTTDLQYSNTHAKMIVAILNDMADKAAKHKARQEGTNTCSQGNEVKVLSSNAGYYIGCFTIEEGPTCRISGYYPTEQSAQEALDDRSFHCIAEENSFCNRGDGCLTR